jgi:hypothetical protein
MYKHEVMELVDESPGKYAIGAMLGGVAARRAQVTEIGPELFDTVRAAIDDAQPPIAEDLQRSPAFLLGVFTGAVIEVEEQQHV